MEKMDGKTMDIVAENVGKLKELFPEAFTEGKVDFEALKEVLGTFVDDRDERYSFTWNGKSKARLIAQTPSTGTLRPCKEESVDWDATQNVFIEGDNLEVLKLLQKSYHKKVKMIYIDPPYNTGKDFVYKDNFKDNIKNYKEITGQVDGEGRNLSNNPETSGRYHTDWLNMMYPRLKLARNLLKDDGVIFISIDDNEVSNLRKMCDEIFGEENFLACMVLLTGANQSGDGVKIQTNTENCLVYSKSNDIVDVRRVDKVDETLRNLNDAPTPLETRPDMGYSIYYNPQRGDFKPVKDYDKEKIHLNEESEVYADDPELLNEGYFPIRPGVRNLKLHRWRWGFDTFIERKDEIEIKTSNGSYAVCFKQSGFNAPKNVLQFGSGTSEVKDLFGGMKIFDFPKGTNYIRRLVSIGTANDDLILDFFAGSATTAHSIFLQNIEDSYHRKFFLVQLPELLDDTEKKKKDNNEAIKFLSDKRLPLTIAEISKERIRRAAAKLKGENPDYDGDLGFKVFKLDSTNIKPWEVDFDMTERTLEDFISNIKTDRREEDVLYEILLKYGLDLTLPITEHTIAGQKVFDIGMGALIICLSNAISLEVVEGMAKLKEELNPEIMRVVFKDSGFKDDVVNTNGFRFSNRLALSM